MYLTRATLFASLLVSGALILATPVPVAAVQDKPTIWQATLGEPNPVTPELSTEELQRQLAAGTPVLDVRSAPEYAIAHIPGTVNLYEKEVEPIPPRASHSSSTVMGRSAENRSDFPRSW
jgi:hypothetical protein